MALALIEPTDATLRLQDALGAEPLSDEGLCGLLRAEVHARGQVQRAVTLERVRRLLGPTGEVEDARLAALCASLVREGDLVLAPGGVLWATPLRAVPLASGFARIFSSLPHRALGAALGRPVATCGVFRTVTWDDALGPQVETVGGRVLTPEVWSGLDRAPIANSAFLTQLDERLAWEAQAPALLDRDGPLDWRGWVPDGEHRGWQRAAEGARLWWARTPFQGHRRAWTAGDGSPSTAAFVELTSEDADRARFALSRIAQASPTMVVEHVDDHAILEIPTWLPRPEHRWLSLQAEAVGGAGQPARWRMSAQHVEPITARLAAQLGLAVETR